MGIGSIGGFAPRNSWHSSYNVVKVIKYNRLKWVGNVAKMENNRSVFKLLAGKSTRKETSRTPCIWRRTILKKITREWLSV